MTLRNIFIPAERPEKTMRELLVPAMGGMDFLSVNNPQTPGKGLRHWRAAFGRAMRQTKE
jgi:hypothetical protein